MEQDRLVGCRRAATPDLPHQCRQFTLNTDVALGVAIPSRNARGRIARLGRCSMRSSPATIIRRSIEQLLAEALTLTALLGSLLKEPQGQLTLQAQTEGGIDRPDGVRLSRRRAARLCPPRPRAARRAAEPSRRSQELFGKGYLAITFDQPAAEERYQGIVPLEGKNLGEAAQSYFAQSEQIPSLVRLAAEKRERALVAGGLLLQHLPEGEEGRERLHTRLDHPDWPHVAILGGSVKAEELTDPELPLDDLIWRLFHEEDEVRTLRGGRAQPRLPLRPGLCPLGDRALSRRRARGDGRRGRADPGRLRLLLVELRDRAEGAQLLSSRVANFIFHALTDAC